MDYKLLLILLLYVPRCVATTYYVSKGGNDITGDGSYGNPWLTIQKAATSASTGDIVRVSSGTYDERVTPANSGSSTNAYITFLGSNVVMRGFNLANKNLVRVFGFEITHPNVTYNYGGIYLNKANQCVVGDNYIHHVNGSGVDIAQYNAWGNSNVIRSNIIEYTGLCQTNVGAATGTIAVTLSGTNNLAEYNIIRHCGDYFYGGGYHTIIRNNILSDTTQADFGTDPHVDLYQISQSANNLSVSSTLFERNFCYSNTLANSHGFLAREVTAGKTVDNITLRQNVIDYIGSYAFSSTCPFIRILNNTISRCVFGGGPYCVSLSDDLPVEAATNCLALNNLFYACGTNSGYIYAVGANASLSNDYDMHYLSGTNFSKPEQHGASNDPLFTLPVVMNFTLQSSSPCIARSVGYTITSGTGNDSTNLTVYDTSSICDGWGMVDPDRLVIGSSTSRVYAISGTNITLSTPVSWSDGQPVFVDGTRDTGALEHRDGGYSFRGSFICDGTTITARITKQDLVRMVEFWIDGIPISLICDPPWECHTTLTGNERIAVRLYSRYASTILAEHASPVVNAHAINARVGTIRSP